MEHVSNQHVTIIIVEESFSSFCRTVVGRSRNYVHGKPSGDSFLGVIDEIYKTPSLWMEWYAGQGQDRTALMFGELCAHGQRNGPTKEASRFVTTQEVVKVN